MVGGGGTSDKDDHVIDLPRRVRSQHIW